MFLGKKKKKVENRKSEGVKSIPVVGPVGFIARNIHRHPSEQSSPDQGHKKKFNSNIIRIKVSDII